MKKHFLSDFDFQLFFVVVALCLVGIINLYSATQGGEVASQKFSYQLMWIGIGFVFMILITFVDYRIIDRFVYPLYGLLLLLLIAVPLVGKAEYGAKRWLQLGGGFRLQPSEFMKIGLIFVFSKYFSEAQKPYGYSLKDLLVPFTLLGIPFLLILVEPDLGTALMIGVIGFSMIVFAKMKLKSMIILVTLAIISFPIAWQFVLKDYQKNRVLTFISPGKDPRGKGFQALQSRIAIGSGKLFGKGFRKGTQTQLNFLPEQRTDFIFSVFAEEHGFVGSLLLLGLYLWFLSIGIRISKNARDKFGALLALGLTLILFWQVFINI
ncbi:MAG: rod shape-determining protein RodA, partial [Deltaproteobacteria bacterium]|nr:rod shape-determining protein RodA [Deltaproteobacteria bacterium]